MTIYCSISKNNAALTSEERIQRFSRYHTMTEKVIAELNEKAGRQLMALGNGYHKCARGKFKPKNPGKYLGNLKNIVYRSSYEIKFMNWLDTTTHVKGWASEEIAIPYISPLDNKPHRYFPDFYVEVQNKQGELERWVVEIKPSSQTAPPVARKRKTKKFIREAATYAVNTRKWEAAEKFCAKNRLQFKIITEKDLNIQY